MQRATSSLFWVEEVGVQRRWAGGGYPRCLRQMREVGVGEGGMEGGRKGGRRQRGIKTPRAHRCWIIGEVFLSCCAAPAPTLTVALSGGGLETPLLSPCAPAFTVCLSGRCEFVLAAVAEGLMSRRDEQFLLWGSFLRLYAWTAFQSFPFTFTLLEDTWTSTDGKGSPPDT